MTKQEWKDKVIDNCKSIGTYKDEFETIYDMLADTLVQIDATKKAFEESDEGVVIRHANNRGNVNWEQNPILRLQNELRRDALTYLRDCGLTAAALKKINDESLNELRKKTSPLAEALAKLG